MEKSDRGKLLYNEARNRKARRVRLIFYFSSTLSAIGLIGIAIIALIFSFVLFNFPFYVQVVGALLTGALLYWAVISMQDINRMRKALRWLKVYELGVRLPTGSEEDFNKSRPPKFIPFTDVQVFYPNEGKIDLPYFSVVLKDPDANPIVISKEFIGNWGRFRRAVKEKLETHKNWYFLKEEGPVYAGSVESTDLQIIHGPKDNKRELSWDLISEAPKTRLKVLKNLVVVTLALRRGGKLKFLVTSETAESLSSNYKKYVDRFWESPEKEEERWEKLEGVEEEKT